MSFIKTNKMAGIKVYLRIIRINAVSFKAHLGTLARAKACTYKSIPNAQKARVLLLLQNHTFVGLGLVGDILGIPMFFSP